RSRSGALLALTQIPVAAQPRVRLPERHRPVVAVRLFRRQIGSRSCDELRLGRALLDAPRPGVEPRAELREVAADVVGEAEVDQRQPFGRTALDLLERSIPSLDVDIRRRRRWQYGAARQDPDAGGVARVERRAVEVADVVRGVTGRGEDFESGGALVGDMQVPLRDGRQLAPELVEGVAVEAPGASLQPRGIEQVRRADLGDPDLQTGVLADERSRGAGVIEVDVREEQVLDLA